ncbi:MAG: hypothetical protein ACJA2Q_002827 [Pseudohongiellaceae bacterium]|jgi:hypothetical protein
MIEEKEARMVACTFYCTRGEFGSQKNQSICLITNCPDSNKRALTSHFLRRYQPIYSFYSLFTCKAMEWDGMGWDGPNLEVIVLDR